MPRLRHGMARVEFFAVQENVMALLAQGHTYASAYDLLKKEGKITMCYGAFRGYAHGGRRPKPDPEHGSKPAKLPPAAQHSTAPPPASAPSVPRNDAAASPDVSGQTKVPACNGPIVVGDKQSSKFGKDKSDPDALM